MKIYLLRGVFTFCTVLLLQVTAYNQTILPCKVLLTSDKEIYSFNNEQQITIQFVLENNSSDVSYQSFENGLSESKIVKSYSIAPASIGSQFFVNITFINNIRFRFVKNLLRECGVQILQLDGIEFPVDQFRFFMLSK